MEKLCQDCNKNESTVHLTQLINNKKVVDTNYLSKLSIDILPAFQLIREKDLEAMSEVERGKINDLIWKKEIDANTHDSFLEFNIGAEKARDLLDPSA